MRNAFHVSLLPLLAVVLVVGAFALTPKDQGWQMNTITFPIEVMDGSDGATETVTVQASGGGGADRIYIRGHSISYPSVEDFSEVKASIRVNGGAWVDLTNATADCVDGTQEKNHFACMGGPYPTKKFTVSASISGGLNNGSNTISFRYNRATKNESPDNFGTPSSGFRVIDLDIWDASGNSIMDGTTKAFDNPANWAPPAGYDNPSDIAAGRDLWEAQNSLIDSPGEHNIVASCADCHATDGADLKYFAFSNKSIIARSVWHGYTDSEGRQIAAYIRTRELKDRDTGEEYSYAAYPWSPVYQPGPRAVSSRSPLDDRTTGTPIHDMPGGGSQFVSAGAGVDWALDNDVETVPFLFPGGASYDDITTKMKPWDIPIALQFPDWNEWLPVHHPLDIWGNGWKTETVTGGRSPYLVWYGGQNDERNARWELDDCFANAGPVNTPSNCVEKAERLADIFFEDSRIWQNIAGPGNQTSIYAGNNTNHDSGFSYHRLNGYRFQGVKMWEVLRKYDLDDEYQQIRPEALDLQYPGGGGRWIFDNAPHLAGEYAGHPTNERWDIWLDNVWYEINTQYNHGMNVRNGVRPNDWAYQHMHSNGLQFLAARHTKSSMLMLQVCNTPQGGGPRGGNDQRQPGMWYQRASHCNWPTLMVWRDWVEPGLEAAQDGLFAAALEMQMRYVAENMMYEFSPVNYNQGNGLFSGDVDANWQRLTGEGGWEPESVAPRYAGQDWGNNRRTPSQYAMGLQKAAGVGVKPSLIDSSAVWLDAMSPSGLWGEYRCTQHGGQQNCPGSSALPTDPIADPLPPPDDPNPDPPPAPTLPSPIEYDRGAPPVVVNAVAEREDFYEVRAGASTPGDPATRYSIAFPDTEFVDEGDTCTWTVRTIYQMNSNREEEGVLPYQSWAGACLGEACLMIYAQERSIQMRNVSTGETGGRIVGSVQPPAELDITCDGTICTGRIDGTVVGNVEDPSPGFSDTCTTDGALGGTDENYVVQWEASPGTPSP